MILRPLTRCLLHSHLACKGCARSPKLCHCGGQAYIVATITKDESLALKQVPYCVECSKTIRGRLAVSYLPPQGCEGKERNPQ
jgi:hypothetical protein